MRRWIALILLVMFPLQAVQAANTGTHVHRGAAHTHPHEAQSVAQLDLAAAAMQGPIASESTRPSHTDCGVCHLVHVPGIMTGAAVETPLPSPTSQDFLESGARLRDAHGMRPERPKWLRSV